MLQKFIQVVKNVKVNPASMLKNIELNRGIVYSQKILVKLMSKGLSRMQAYDMVQRISLNVINGNSTFQEEVSRDKQINKFLTQREIKDISRR